jgi:hypothetical protein
VVGVFEQQLNFPACVVQNHTSVIDRSMHRRCADAAGFGTAFISIVTRAGVSARTFCVTRAVGNGRGSGRQLRVHGRVAGRSMDAKKLRSVRREQGSKPRREMSVRERQRETATHACFGQWTWSVFVKRSRRHSRSTHAPNKSGNMDTRLSTDRQNVESF